MRLEEINLDVITPDFMTDDPVIKALNEVLEGVTKEITSNMGRLSIWDSLDKLSEAELDELAYEMNIPWYNNTYTKAKKLDIITKGDNYVQKLGTPYALQYVLDDIFGNCTIKESGIDYEGDPHKFFISVDNGVNLNAVTYGRFVYILGKIKRASSWVDGVSSTYVSELVGVQAAAPSDIITTVAELDRTGHVGYSEVNQKMTVSLSSIKSDSITMKRG